MRERVANFTSSTRKGNSSLEDERRWERAFSRFYFFEEEGRQFLLQERELAPQKGRESGPSMAKVDSKRGLSGGASIERDRPLKNIMDVAKR